MENTIKNTNSNYGLKRIIFIDSAKFKNIDIDISENTLLLGASGVGKSSIMRAVLFFYTMNSDKEILGIAVGETKKGFNDWYFNIDGSSYIVYEYTTTNGRFLFVVTRRRQLQYTFIDITNYDDNLENLLTDDIDVPLVYSDFVAKLSSLNLDFYTTNEKAEYRKIFCFEEYKKFSQDFRRKQLQDCKFYLFKSLKDVDYYGKYLSKVFLNNKITENNIKSMLSSLLDMDSNNELLSIGSISLDDLRIRLDEVVRKEEDYERFSNRIPKIQKLNDTIKEHNSNLSEQNRLKNRLIQFKLSSSDILSVLQKEKLEAKENYDIKNQELLDEKKKYDDSIKSIASQKGALDVKIKDVSALKAHYLNINIDSLAIKYNMIDGLNSLKNKYQAQLSSIGEDENKILAKKESDKKEAKEKIEDSFKERKDKLILKLTEMNVEFRVIEDEKTNRTNTELNPQNQIVTKLGLELNTAKGNLRAYNSDLSGLKNKRLESDKLKEINDAIKAKNHDIDRDENTSSAATKNIIKLENDKILNSENYSKEEEKLKDYYAKEKEKINTKIDDIQDKINKLLNIDKSSIFGIANKDDSYFKNHIAHILKDEILYDENIPIEKIDDTGTVYGYRLTFEPEKIEQKIGGLKKTISDCRNSLIFLNDEEKTKNNQLISATNLKNKSIEESIKKLEEENRRLKRVLEQKKTDLETLNKGFDEETDRLNLENQNAIEQKTKEISVVEENINIMEQKLSAEKSTKESIEKSINESYTTSINILTDTQKSVDSSLLGIDNDIKNNILKSDNNIELVYKEIFRNKNIDASKIESIKKKINRLDKIVNKTNNRRTDIENYLNKDKALIDGLFLLIENLNQLIEREDSLNKSFEALISSIESNIKTLSDIFNKKLRVYNEYNEFTVRFTEYEDLYKLDFKNTNYENLKDEFLNLIYKGDNELINIPNRLNNIKDRISKLETEIKLLVIEVTKGFERDNTLGLPIVDGDIDIKGIYEHKQIGQKYIEYMINELHIQAKEMLSDNILETIKYISNTIQNVRSKIGETEKIIEDINSSIEDNIIDIQVIDYLKIKHSMNTTNIIIESIDKLIDFVEDNNFIYTGIFSAKEHQTIFDEVYSRIKALARTLKESNARAITVNDLINISFDITENGNKFTNLSTLSDIGSNGTGIMAKAIIYISLLHKNAIKCSLDDKQFFHCIMDEIGQISEEYFEQLMLWARKKGFLFLNGIPVEAEGVLAIYNNVYLGTSTNGESDFNNILKRFI
jgi:hypothetical protein